MNVRFGSLRKELNKRESELDERKHEIVTLNTQLSQANDDIGKKAISIRDLQMEVSRVSSELALVQRDNEETCRQLTDTQVKLGDLRGSLKDANEINSYQGKEIKDKEKMDSTEDFKEKAD